MWNQNGGAHIQDFSVQFLHFGAYFEDHDFALRLLAKSRHNQVLVVQDPGQPGPLFGYNVMAALTDRTRRFSGLVNANLSIFANSAQISTTATPLSTE